ncbi:hypothetical protein [uncultured Microbacterium sp.]|uniref:hypothetical protein n=1 Tax=uncultured Microbacterium sp. TaxID=191216 RepID=UPI0035CAE79A
MHEYPLRFTKEDAIRSLIESTYSAPRTVLIESDDGAVRLPVVLTSATAQYVPFAAHTGDTPAGCYEQPDWRLEGWVVPSGFNPRQPPAHVRLFIPAPFDDTLLWQVIPIGITPDEEIRVISD